VSILGENKSAELTVFLADDHRIVRDGLRAMAEREKGLRIVGEATDGRSLVEGVVAIRPDVVITDLAMTELNGIEAVRQLRAAGYRGVIVMLSGHSERRVISQALDAGVNAYVHKEYAFEQIITAIAAARRGEIWLSPELAALNDSNRVPTLAELLSPREREVLQLFAEGHGTKEIAFRLGLSPKTVEVHRLNLFAKLKVNNVIELTRIAIKEGVVHL
jgi:DNA-binding NarL/FixJ family response regulator